jgi:uncharacterized SAM-dependent methyltransferase
LRGTASKFDDRQFAPAEAREFLTGTRTLLGPGAAFIVGVDLKKDLDILLPAYNDSEGVTAAFNMNLLVRVNRELGGTFDIDAFAHEAVYNEREGRIETHLRSLKSQNAEVLGEPFHFEAGETIHTKIPTNTPWGSFRNSLARPAGSRDRRGPMRRHYSASTI